MLNIFKKIFYFPGAFYFAVFAKLYLLRWKPRIIVVTGSNGKTTLLHMIASQLGDKAKYSYHANSSYGIPFDILDFHRKDLTFLEWPLIILKTPLTVFNKIYKESIYVVEADCDRPFEGTFLSRLLTPEVTLWVDISRTHSMNFEQIAKKRGKKIEEVIAKEFAEYAARTKGLVIANGDNNYIVEALKKIDVSSILVKRNEQVIKHVIDFKGTEFVIDGETYKFKYLLPEETFYQIALTHELVNYLNFKLDKSFRHFILPPGRSSVFKGIKGITIVDSTYNANLGSMKVILNLFSKIKSANKWAVLGDMLEQGENEIQEHKNLAAEINKHHFEKVILMGPRVKKYTQPLIQKQTAVFERPDDVLNYIKGNLNGGEVILFKGARFFEGVIGNLLLDKREKKNLVRRERIWEERRKEFGL